MKPHIRPQRFGPYKWSCACKHYRGWGNSAADAYRSWEAFWTVWP